MAQLFPRSANTVARVSILGAAFGALGLVGGSYAFQSSPYVTKVRVILPQPVQFSHEHHVSGLGIDCRYCHSAVETSASAGVPPTYTCMSCHSQIWTNAPILEPIRASLRENRPVEWRRVHDLPDFVYFNHSIHVNKGVGCVECHGRLDKMPMVYKAEPHSMGWCLECHRNPEERVRPPSEVFNMSYDPNDFLKSYGVSSRAELGEKLVEQQHIQRAGLDQCSVCHR
jgi:hypothetical protein